MTRDPDRMKFLALKLKAGVSLSAEEQREWDRDAHLGDRIAAGLPLTEAEKAQLERAKNAVFEVRDGSIWVGDASAPRDLAEWKEAVAVARSKSSPAAVTEKRQT